MKFFLFLRELFVVSCYRGIFSYILLQVLVASLSYQTIFLMSPRAKLQLSLVQSTMQLSWTCSPVTTYPDKSKASTSWTYAMLSPSNSRVTYVITHATEP